MKTNMFGFSCTCFAAATALVALMAVAGPASAEMFNFEDIPIGSYPSALTVTNGSLTLTVTPEGNPAGFVVINSEFLGIPLLGNRSLVGSNTATLQFGEFTPVRFTFSSPVDAITFAFGDSGGDGDSPVTIQAFDDANVLLGVLNDTYPDNFSVGKMLTGNFPGASYFILRSGSIQGNSNSIFWEVASVTPSLVVPEPATLLLLGIGAVGLIGHRRRRSADNSV